jgi:hypothetical protein
MPPPASGIIALCYPSRFSSLLKSVQAGARPVFKACLQKAFCQYRGFFKERVNKVCACDFLLSSIYEIRFLVSSYLGSQTIPCLQSIWSTSSFAVIFTSNAASHPSDIEVLMRRVLVPTGRFSSTSSTYVSKYATHWREVLSKAVVMSS